MICEIVYFKKLTYLNLKNCDTYVLCTLTNTLIDYVILENNKQF